MTNISFYVSNHNAYKGTGMYVYGKLLVLHGTYGPMEIKWAVYNT